MNSALLHKLWLETRIIQLEKEIKSVGIQLYTLHLECAAYRHELDKIREQEDKELSQN